VWQYPGEDEEATVWNAFSFLQYLPGRDELVMPPGGGIVRIYHVLVTTNNTVRTVEELNARAKNVVVHVLDSMHKHVCRAVDEAFQAEEFQARLAQDRWFGLATNSVLLTNTARLTMVFDVLDRNRDGALSLEELTPFARALVGIDGDGNVQRFFDDLDTNKDGVLSKSEFLAYFRQRFGCNDLDVLSKEAQDLLDRAFEKLKGHIDDFIRSIKNESAARVAVYKALPDGAYGEIETLGKAVVKGLALPLLANAKLRLWLEDPSLDLWSMGETTFNIALGRRRARRRMVLQDSLDAAISTPDNEAKHHFRHDAMGRVVVDDGVARMCDGGFVLSKGKSKVDSKVEVLKDGHRTATVALALEDCLERRLVSGNGATALERKDLYTNETSLIEQVQLGEHENVERLLLAGAVPNAATKGTSLPPRSDPTQGFCSPPVRVQADARARVLTIGRRSEQAGTGR